MDRFCGKCGAPTDASGRCPNCDPAPGGTGLKVSRSFGDRAADRRSPTPNPNPPMNPNPPANPNPPVNPNPPDKAKTPGRQPKKKAAPAKASGKKGRLAVKLVLIGLAALLAIFLILSALQYFGVLNIPFLGKLLGGIGLSKNADKKDEGPRIIPEETLERPDPELYMSEFGTVLKKTAPKDSADVLNEADAFRAFRDRGFTDYPIVACYSMNGEYRGEQEISETGTEKHPYYQTYFAANDGAFWSVMLVNGEFMAEPLTFNSEQNWSTPHMVSESETFQNYDGSANLFYEIAPDRYSIFLKTVDRIDADTLNELDRWEVDER